MRVASKNRGGDQTRWALETIVSPILPGLEGCSFVDISGRAAIPCAPRQSTGGKDQQPAAADGRFPKKTTAIDLLFHIRLLFSEPITALRLEFFRVQLTGQ